MEFLSECQESIKAGKRDLPFAIQDKLTAGTTVSGTMLLARQAGIEIFATGGIGGVHRGAIDGANPSFDISSDLTELSCNSVMVVCAGIKSILDIPRTLEYLETLAVPVATLSNLEEVDFPAFYFNESGIKSFKIAHGPNHAADYWLKIRDHLNMNTGFLLAVPPDALSQAEQDLLKLATNQALDLAAQQNISGKEATPFLLEQINQISKGLSLRTPPPI